MGLGTEIQCGCTGVKVWIILIPFGVDKDIKRFGQAPRLIINVPDPEDLPALFPGFLIPRYIDVFIHLGIGRQNHQGTEIHFLIVFRLEFNGFTDNLPVGANGIGILELVSRCNA